MTDIGVMKALRSKAIWLWIVVTLVTTAALAAPVSAYSSHATITAAASELLVEHGHVHGGDLDDLHDATDHVHDLPHVQPSVDLSLLNWPDIWMMRLADAWVQTLLRDLDRPPRPFP